MDIDTHRIAAMLSFGERGVSDKDAAVAALALHPLDDSPVPSRPYEKAVRKLSRQFAKRTRRASPQEIGPDARATLAEYKQLAQSHGETYYVTRYDTPIGGD